LFSVSIASFASETGKMIIVPENHIEFSGTIIILPVSDAKLAIETENKVCFCGSIEKSDYSASGRTER
jgi:hypothetical protein